MQLIDVEVEFAGGTLTCRGTVTPVGAEAVSADAQSMTSQAASFLLHAPEGGKLLTDTGVADLDAGDYLFTQEGIFFRGVAAK
jgi:hypothetical protein